MRAWFRTQREKPARLLRVSPRPGAAPIAVTLKRNRRARRLVLSVDPGQAAPVLVIPPHVSIGEAQSFLDSRAGWLERRLNALPPRTAFADGATIPFLGGALTLRHAAGARGAAWREGEALIVAGDPRHLARRATEWLKRAARAEFARRAGEKAALIGRPAPRVAVGDPKRQWGSCSAGGVLRLSWRLVLAPGEVVDYVVAHEVAHLAEMNHGREFWAAVARLTPNAGAARTWLKRHGHGLLRYG
jgi:predicted metal-dependent hydrolase